MDNWISVDDKPLVTVVEGSEGYWQVNEGIPDEFLAAVPVHDSAKNKDFWWIRHCVIESERGLCVVTDDDTEIAGWTIEDVTHWQPLPNPPQTPSQLT